MRSVEALDSPPNGSFAIVTANLFFIFLRLYDKIYSAIIPVCTLRNILCTFALAAKRRIIPDITA